MEITKETLKTIKSIELALENCDYFEIPSEEVLDINFLNITLKDDGNYAEDGFILLSKNATKILSSMSDDFDNEEYVEKDFYSLKNRLKDYCDLCHIILNYKDGSTDTIYIPFEPLEGVITWFIEYTNCASAEILDDGSMLISCGKDSKLLSRVDDNYNDLIVWFDKRVKQKFKDIMNVQIYRFESSKEITNNLEMDCKILNNQLKGMNLNLEFCDVSCLNFALDFGRDNKHCLCMSRLKDGTIFVRISDMIEFRCRAIVEHNSNPYSDEGAYEDDADFIEVLCGDAKEEKVVDLAYNHYASDVTIKKDYILNIFERVLAKDISLEYFKGWLKVATDLMCYYISKPFIAEENLEIFSRGLRCLYYDLLYYNSLDDCLDLIANKWNELKRLFNV